MVYGIRLLLLLLTFVITNGAIFPDYPACTEQGIVFKKSVNYTKCSTINNTHEEYRSLCGPDSESVFQYIDMDGLACSLSSAVVVGGISTGTRYNTKLFIKNGTITRNASSKIAHRLFTVHYATLDLTNMVLAQGLVVHPGQNGINPCESEGDDLCYGGLVFLSSGDLEARATHFLDGEAYSGGAIYARLSSSVDLSSYGFYALSDPSCSIEGNRAQNKGGGIFVGEGSILYNSLYNDYDSIKSLIKNNTVGYINIGQPIHTDLKIHGRSVASYPCYAENQTVKKCSHYAMGGGIYLESSKQRKNNFWLNLIIKDNSATGAGGGIYAEGSDDPYRRVTLELEDTIIQNNTVGYT